MACAMYGGRVGNRGPDCTRLPARNRPDVGEATMADYEVFELGDVALQCGITLPQAKLAYKTYGKLAAGWDNVVILVANS